MIIVGCYPDQIAESPDKAGNLQAVERALSAVLPQEVVLHLLPFFPSCGDGGFSVTDIRRVANAWKLIVDGVFNHCGVNHEVVRKFKESPKLYGRYFYVGLSPNPLSPRGWPANGEIVTSEGSVLVRQTLSRRSVDLNLESDDVVELISDALDVYRDNGIWGIRLDSVAYYKKGDLIRHNDGANELAERVAELVRGHGLALVSQNDCDRYGIGYFANPGFDDIPIYDFGYSAMLVLSVLEGSPRELCDYLNGYSTLGRRLIRAPRTHDGILLKTTSLSADQVSRLAALAESLDLGLRTINGNPYELNCSLPHVFSKVAEDVFAPVRMTVVLTAVIDGIPYLYLPYLLGFQPELGGCGPASSRLDPADPRTLNRLPLLANDLDMDGAISELPVLLQKTQELHDILGPSRDNGEVTYECLGPLLCARTKDGSMTAYVNLSCEEAPCPSPAEDHRVFIRSSLSDGIVDAYGYAIYLKEECGREQRA